ncbi:putative nucleocapsid [Lactuca Big Vein associated Phlebovirus]|nr:putative nucleocapsid [Lactuca Big Vein associated Phlebovirus]
MSSVTEAEYNLMIQMIDEVVPEGDIMQMAEDVSFRGFDPMTIYRIITTKIDKDASVKSALFMMIMFGLTRGFGGGKTWESIISRTNPAGREKLTEAKNKLDVKLSRPNDETTITIPRLMQVFCMYTYTIFCILMKNGKIRAFDYKGNLPQRLCWIGSPACMSPAAWLKWGNDYVEFSQHCSKVWNREQDEVVAKRFAELAYRTATWPANKRLKVKDLALKLVVEREEEEEEEEIIKVPKKTVKKVSPEFSETSSSRHGES